jgi:3-deoxy-7-phosphoheptulonate synthase
MLIVMQHNALPGDIDRVCGVIRELGYEPRAMPGAERTAVGITGNDRPIDADRFEGLPGVREVLRVSSPYKLVSREWQPANTVVTLGTGVRIGDGSVVVMGGPCAVESEEQLMRAAEFVAATGVRVLRGGAFKPRTSPYGFQGLGLEGLKLLAKARERFGLAIVTEAIDAESAQWVAEYADLVQIGARNMQNFALLKQVGRLGKPVMLKRGPSATIKEWLLAAEYIACEGNSQIILCERGIRGFDDSTRNVLDLTAIPVAKGLSHLPVMADPSHGTGRRDKVTPMARAAVAAGADGVIVEMHPEPERALSDGAQSLHPGEFASMVRQVAAVAGVLGRGF